MTNQEAIKFLQQLYPNGGHCWLDEQRIEAIGMAVKALQEEPVELKEADLENYNKVQKIRKEVARIQLYTQSEVLKQVLDYIDEVQKEPVSNPTPNEKMSVERWKKACEAACCDINYRSHYGLTETRDDYFVDGVQWADEHPKEEPVNEDLSDYINELSKQFPEVSFAKLSRIAVRVAKWQKQQDQSTIELAEDHAYFAGRVKTVDEVKEKLISEVLPCFMHGGEADEVVAMLDEKLLKDE